MVSHLRIPSPPIKKKGADSVDTEHLNKNADLGDADVETDGVKEQFSHETKETWKGVYSHIIPDAALW